MGTHDAVPTPPPPPPQPALRPCPRCGLTDQVRSVPAVYHAGRSTVTSRHPHGDHHHSRTREIVSDLSRALAPAPIDNRAPVRTAVGVGVALLMIAVFTFLAGTFAGEFNDDDPQFSTFQDHHAFEISPMVPAVALILAGILFLTATLLHVSANEQLAGRPQAERLWAKAWYCARCGTVHFPAAVGLGTAALDLREFRRIVWQTGGYGHLLDRY
ncbi:hypothetical protein [Kitasatospora sp. NPDC096140]|uniref:hypothetical protein n=1 Tax=Kitasatospora sp. NPDC096140 TaxID=3155425 RepID=UPI00331C9794